MTPRHSPLTLSAIEAALPCFGIGVTPADVHQAVGLWSRVTIRAVLRQLVTDGRAQFDGPDGNRRYRRVGGDAVVVAEAAARVSEVLRAVCR